MLQRTTPVMILILLLMAWACIPIPSSTNTSANTIGKELEFSDRVYENQVRSVKLQPVGNIPYSRVSTPVIPLSSGTQLRLEFDDLSEYTDYYMLRLEYLKADWTRSYVNSIDYLYEYNEFRINDFELSLDTKVKYVHYSAILPRVKIPGNYVVIVYREGDENDIILSRRFVVFDNSVTVTGPDNQTGFSNLGGHRIDFNVFYRNLRLEDPYNQVIATIRQNGRWDNIRTNIKPTFVKEDQGKLEYRLFDNSNEFSPGNEYRFFDIRSIVSPGQFVRSIDRMSNPVSISLSLDKPRTGLAYSFHRDINGAYELVNMDAGNSTYYSDYLLVNFELEIPNDPDREIYIFGELTNWQRLPEARMFFDPQTGTYRGSLLLKQGWYDYQYYQEAPGRDPNILEGDHINTENYYEILIYHKPIGSREEHCVGYYQFGINERMR